MRFAQRGVFCFRLPQNIIVLSSFLVGASLHIPSGSGLRYSPSRHARLPPALLVPPSGTFLCAVFKVLRLNADLLYEFFC